MTLLGRITLPFRYRLLNMLGTGLRRIRVPIAEFDEQALCRAAMRRTGLSDMGDPSFFLSPLRGGQEVIVLVLHVLLLVDHGDECVDDGRIKVVALVPDEVA
jgi:hypothetical protein